MTNSKWVPLSEFKNEKPFAVFFSSKLQNDEDFPGLPIVSAPFEDVEKILSYPWFVNMGYDFAVGIDGFDSDSWKSLKDSLPEEDEFVLLRVPKGSLARNTSLEVTESNPEYVKNGNAVKHMNAIAWSRIPYPLPA